MSELADRFMNALQTLERERDVEAIAALFDERAELRRAPRAHTYQGGEGVRAFWREYLDAFSRIETRFAEVTVQDGRTVLEWHSQATSASGQPVAYDGVTVIEGDGERVQRFRTYYDAASAGMGAAARVTG